MIKLNCVKKWLLLPLLLLLTSCQDYGGMKDHLIKGYKNRDAYCFYIGMIDLPYLAEPVDIWNEDEENISHTNILNERLTTFEQAGLLTSTAATGKDGKTYPLYSLTAEGKKYYKAPKAAGIYHRDDLKDAQFCFGRRIIIDITDITDRETDFYGGKTTETIVDFTYTLKNVPDWVNHPAIKVLDEYNIEYVNEDTVREGQVYLTKSGGTYYNYGTGRSIETTRLGFYL